MLDKGEIERAISELEAAKDHSKSMCARLADLYSIRDHAFPSEPEIAKYSQSASGFKISSPLETYGDSDFLIVISGKNMDSVFSVMDDLMDTLKVSFPRAYDSVMRKLKEI